MTTRLRTGSDAGQRCAAGRNSRSIGTDPAPAAARRRPAPTTIGALAVLVAAPLAACSAPAPAPVAAPPSTTVASVAATPSPSSTPSPSPAAPRPKPTITGNVKLYTLGPKGYGPLRLGMTVAEANATRLTTDVPAGAECIVDVVLLGGSEYRDLNGQVMFKHGKVAVIWAIPGVATAEGVEIGSPLAKVLEEYPTWKSVDGNHAGHGRVPVPGSSTVQYRIDVRDGKVYSISLEAQNGRCYE